MGLRPSRARVKRRPTPVPTRAVSPVFRAPSHLESLQSAIRLCRPALRAALRAGDPPPFGSPWHLLPPGLADGQGCRREERSAPMKPKTRSVMSAKQSETIMESGTEIFIPLNKLKSLRRMPARRRTARRRSKPMRLASQPRVSCKIWSLNRSWTGRGQPPGFYFVTVGEGRRLAQLLRVNRHPVAGGGTAAAAFLLPSFGIGLAC
jgi:hypothetical protein